MNGTEDELVTLRLLLLELWAVLVLATIVGFMGPFGTYAQSGLASRIGNWSLLLLGAYLLIRPAIALLRKLASFTSLPSDALVFWGVWICSAPLAVIWRTVGQNEFRQLGGYAGLVPFSLLCSLAVLGVTRWAAGIDLRLSRDADAGDRDLPSRSEIASETEPSPDEPPPDSAPVQPALARRLSPRFTGPILALQSEDHYVRVHGADDSELVLMRLRDAIAEMDGVAGEQVHRSWWVARQGIAGAAATGRNWTIDLTSGVAVPVARDSISRLQRAGFLPSRSG